MKKILVFLFWVMMVFIGLYLALQFCRVAEKIKNDGGRELNKTVQKKRINIYYRVRSGDSIERIARTFKVLPYHLRETNKMVPGVVIHPGQLLKIPWIKWPTYEGKASWYGPGFHGRRMANRDIYNQNKILVAHRHYPFGTKLKITNLENGKSVVAPVLDRGPYTMKGGKYNREIDLSLGAAKALGAVEKGVIPVRIEPLG